MKHSEALIKQRGVRLNWLYKFLTEAAALACDSVAREERIPRASRL
jgi:hypothetical protein